MYILLLFLLVNSGSCSLTVDYYEKLISNWTRKAESYKIPDNNEEFKQGLGSEITEFGSYDFIIIGAGTSGSVLATRLSEIDDFKILVLEAGGNEDDYNEIPTFIPNLQLSENNWGYQSIPQKTCCLAMKDQKCSLPRGKIIGGSSSINGMMYVRGNSHDYDKWAKLGNLGWAYKDVLPYFLKSENSQIMGDKKYHNKGGLWNVEYLLPESQLLEKFFQATSDLNIPHQDFNGYQQYGTSRLQINTKQGKRQSTGKAFLDFARRRENLEVVIKAYATKIIIDPSTKKAIKVEFIKNKRKYVAEAKKEIISSGGAYNSPQLLMLSGIGPKNHLNQLGIKVVADLPVGQNLYEHPFFTSLVFRTNFTINTPDMKNQIEMYLNGIGPLTKGLGAEAIGFIDNRKKGRNVPDIEYFFIPPGRTNIPSRQETINYNDTIINNFLNTINGSTDTQIFLTLLHQKSKGQVTLKSANPIDFPNIDLNLFSNEEDIDRFIEGIEFVLELLNTKPFRDIDAHLLDYPICKQFEKLSRNFWKCLIQNLASITHHPIGTNSMGVTTANSVVNHHLQVHGIRGLRVVDASIMPATTSGHTSAPCVMIAEKIATQIKHDYGYFKKTLSFCDIFKFDYTIF